MFSFWVFPNKLLAAMIFDAGETKNGISTYLFVLQSVKNHVKAMNRKRKSLKTSDLSVEEILHQYMIYDDSD